MCSKNKKEILHKNLKTIVGLLFSYNLMLYESLASEKDDNEDLTLKRDNTCKLLGK